MDDSVNMITIFYADCYVTSGPVIVVTTVRYKTPNWNLRHQLG